MAARRRSTGCFMASLNTGDHSRTLTTGIAGKSDSATQAKTGDGTRPHPRQIGLAPQVRGGREPRKFHTAVWDTVWPSETRSRVRVTGRVVAVRLKILGQPIRAAARRIAPVRRR